MSSPPPVNGICFQPEIFSSPESPGHNIIAAIHHLPEQHSRAVSFAAKSNAESSFSFLSDPDPPDDLNVSESYTAPPPATDLSNRISQLYQRVRQIQEDAKTKAKTARTPEKVAEKENTSSLREEIARSNPLVMKMLNDRKKNAAAIAKPPQPLIPQPDTTQPQNSGPTENKIPPPQYLKSINHHPVQHYEDSNERFQEPQQQLYFQPQQQPQTLQSRVIQIVRGEDEIGRQPTYSLQNDQSSGAWSSQQASVLPMEQQMYVNSQEGQIYSSETQNSEPSLYAGRQYPHPQQQQQYFYHAGSYSAPNHHSPSPGVNYQEQRRDERFRGQGYSPMLRRPDQRYAGELEEVAQRVKKQPIEERLLEAGRMREMRLKELRRQREEEIRAKANLRGQPVLSRETQMLAHQVARRTAPMTMQNTRQPSPQIYSVERVNTRFDTIFQELAARDQRAAQRIQRAVAQDFTPIAQTSEPCSSRQPSGPQIIDYSQDKMQIFSGPPSINQSYRNTLSLSSIGKESNRRFPHETPPRIKQRIIDLILEGDEINTSIHSSHKKAMRRSSYRPSPSRPQFFTEQSRKMLPGGHPSQEGLLLNDTSNSLASFSPKAQSYGNLRSMPINRVQKTPPRRAFEWTQDLSQQSRQQRRDQLFPRFSELGLLQRNDLWIAAKEAKIQRAREATKNVDLQGCTFSPQIYSRTPRSVERSVNTTFNSVKRMSSLERQILNHSNSYSQIHSLKTARHNSFCAFQPYMTPTNHSHKYTSMSEKRLPIVLMEPNRRFGEEFQTFANTHGVDIPEGETMYGCGGGTGGFQMSGSRSSSFRKHADTPV